MLVLVATGALVGCSPPSSTVTIASKDQTGRAIHDVLDGPDAKVRIELEGAGAVLTVTKRGDSVTLQFPNGSPDVRMSVAELNLKLAEDDILMCKSNLKNVGTACEMWSTDNNGRYPKTLAELTPKYLKEIPVCPAAGTDTYSATFKSRAAPDLFRVKCEGEFHKLAECPADYPQYRSDVGLISQPSP